MPRICPESSTSFVNSVGIHECPVDADKIPLFAASVGESSPSEAVIRTHARINIHRRVAMVLRAWICVSSSVSCDMYLVCFLQWYVMYGGTFVSASVVGAN